MLKERFVVDGTSFLPTTVMVRSEVWAVTVVSGVPATVMVVAATAVTRSRRRRLAALALVPDSVMMSPTLKPEVRKLPPEVTMVEVYTALVVRGEETSILDFFLNGP